jgi:teichuronic acid biosynthesis glycosyltransferase TuaC
MGARDVMTLPSWAEGTPNVVLEALASGRPVVATRVGGIPDLLQGRGAGVVVPPRDAETLAAALQEALERRWDEAAICARGPTSWRESAAGVASVLEGVHASRRARLSRGRTQDRTQNWTEARRKNSA